MSARETMKQALEALEASIDVPCYGGHPKQEAAAAALRAQLEQPDRQALQAAGTHPAPCARHCEAKAYEIEIRGLKSALRAAPQQQAEPVAWMHTTATGHVYFRKKPQDAIFNPQPLYLGKSHD